jgi:predicted O-linked N-acetylglucosamine transferase (SPINDLY family)
MSETETILFLPTPAEIDTMVNPTGADLVQETEDLFRHGEWAQASANLKRMMRQKYAPGTKGYTEAQCQQALADCAMNMGLNSQAVTHYRECLRLDPTIRLALENLIFLVDALPWTTPGVAKRLRDQWWIQHGSHAYAKRLPCLNVRDPEKKLRVGYVSADFRFHSAVISFASVVQHPTDQIEPVFYSTLPEAFYDRITQDWKAQWGAHFVDVSQHTPEAFAGIVRQDRIDILVDLSGYTAGNRLLSFAYAPAPIRITAWGYATGVGCPAMTHLFADAVVATKETRAALVEEVVDLPCVIGFQPRPDLPPPTPLPSLNGAPVQFAVFQRASKLNADVLKVYTQILKRVPESVILFKGADYSPRIREWIVQEMRSVRGQIRFEFGASHLDHQSWYQAVDLSLDPWPQTGGVSTMESCWQGVPVLTLIGPRVIQRTTASILTTLGLPEFITTTQRQYVQTAVDLVTIRRDWLNDVRLGLRDRMQTSPIITGYRDAVEAKYRELWRAYCAESPEAA